MSPKFVFGYTILVSLVRFFCGPLKGPLFVSTFMRNVAKIISYISWQSFSFALSTSTLFNVFLIQFSWSGYLRAWLKRKKIRENCSFRYFISVGESILVIRFCNNGFSVKRLLWRSTGTLYCWFILFLIISFSRFQYFNLHFGSLKLCFTNLVLEIHDNLSLIFLSSLEISNLIYFTHFQLSPIIMGHTSKLQAQVCPICQNLIQSKTIRLWFYGHFSAR